MKERAKNFKGTLGRLLEFMRPYRLSLLAVTILAILSAAFGIYGPKLLGKATTKIFEGIIGKITGTSGGIDFQAIGHILLFLLGIYGISTLFGYLQGFLMTGVAMKVTYTLRREIAAKINRMPFAFFDNANQGDVLSRVTNDVDSISQTLNQTLSGIITSITTVIGVLIMMLSINLTMTLLSLLIIPISMGLMVLVIRFSQKYFKQQQEYLGRVNGYVEEMYGGHLVVKSYNAEQKTVNQFSTINDRLYQGAWKSQFFSWLIMPIMMVVSNVGYVAVCIAGGILAAQRTIQIGDVQAFIQYVRNFTRPLSQLANISNVLQQTVAAAERVFEFLDQSEEREDGPLAIEKERVAGHVTFDHVSFGYHPETMIIKDFSLEVKPGQKVAIVGPTGAGKTTLVKLLMRFYDVNQGSIKIDDVPIGDYSRHNLRSHLSMVLQDTWLYNASIMENLRYGHLAADDEQVKEAAKMAHVNHFVMALPHGYDMIVNEEATNISQGQKQLMTIARAILSNPEILILDEATSSVDTRTELQIQSAMNRLMKGRTSFIIAHRLSTIKDADIILVMDKGDIVEQGNHHELLAQKGFYAKLYNSQF